MTNALTMGDRKATPDRLPRSTAATQILIQLRQAILAMDLPPGTPLTEKQLTERFGVSRTPVRIPVSTLPEAVVIRKALEQAALELAIARADTAALDELERVIARQQAMASIDDRDGFHAADEAFHETIATIAGHPGIWRVAQQAKVQIDRCRRLTLPTPGRMGQVIAEHRAILAAMRKRDGAQARQALDRHLSMVLPDIDTFRQSHPDYFV